MVGLVLLLHMLQTTLFIGNAWSSCDIASFPSINATVNKTVLIECRSNCSKIRLLTKQGTDPEEEIRPYTELQPVFTYYGTMARFLLIESLNNASLICRAFVDGKSYAKKSRILLQESLQSVKNLSVTSNANRTIFTWIRPLAVLHGVKVNYSIQFFRENNMLYDQIVTETSFSIPSVCPPCRQSNFTVAPIAEQLRGEAISISNNATCTEGYQITMMDNKSFSINHSENSVQIAFKLMIYDNWCMPSTATITTVCLQHSDTNKTCALDNLSFEDGFIIIANLSAHDFCSVSLIPQYSNGYTSPSPPKSFNLSLFDTKSIIKLKNVTSDTLCVTCNFAPWTKDGTSCVVLIVIQEMLYSASKVALKNSTRKGLACFPDLPTDKQYNITIAVGESDNQTLHFGSDHIMISTKFISSDNTDSKNSCTWQMPLCIVLCLIAILIGAAGIALCLYLLKIKGYKLGDSKHRANNSADYRNAGYTVDTIDHRSEERADNPQHGADNSQHGADNPEHGADNPQPHRANVTDLKDSPKIIDPDPKNDKDDLSYLYLPSEEQQPGTSNTVVGGSLPSSLANSYSLTGKSSDYSDLAPLAHDHMHEEIIQGQGQGQGQDVRQRKKSTTTQF